MDGLARIISTLLVCPWVSNHGYEYGTQWRTPQLRVHQPKPEAGLTLTSQDGSLPLSNPGVTSRLLLLLATDFFLVKRLRVDLHELYLHLLVDATFKPALGKVGLTRWGQAGGQGQELLSGVCVYVCVVTYTCPPPQALTAAYPILSGLFSRGIGTAEDSVFSFSVQVGREKECCMCGQGRRP